MMSIAQDITRISLQGQKESVIRMLNAVLCNLSVEKSIVAEDDLETINQKIKDEHDGYGFRIRIPDLLETEMLQMPEFLKIKEDFESKKDRDQDNFTAPAVDILKVRQAGDDYANKLKLAQARITNKSGLGDGLSSYEQAHCKVTLTDTGYRIYRTPNQNYNSGSNSVMWGGFVLDNTGNRFNLQKGHRYLIMFDVLKNSVLRY